MIGQYILDPTKTVSRKYSFSPQYIQEHRFYYHPLRQDARDDPEQLNKLINLQDILATLQWLHAIYCNSEHIGDEGSNPHGARLL